jgi:hypothetical protein
MEETINYLHQWNADRNVWKFNKVHQIKLLKSVFDREKVPLS